MIIEVIRLEKHEEDSLAEQITLIVKGIKQDIAIRDFLEAGIITMINVCRTGGTGNGKEVRWRLLKKGACFFYKQSEKIATR